ATVCEASGGASIAAAPMASRVERMPSMTSLPVLVGHHGAAAGIVRQSPGRPVDRLESEDFAAGRAYGLFLECKSARGHQCPLRVSGAKGKRSEILIVSSL